jgi:hypothetical protein
MRCALPCPLPFWLRSGLRAGHSQTPSKAEPSKPRQLVIANSPWTGDFDQMLERQWIRVYAPFSRSLNYSDRGRERGIAVELVRDWERYLNIKYAKELGKRPLTIYIAPASRDKLLPFLEYGLGDVAIGNLTVTEERLKDVDFVPGAGKPRGATSIPTSGSTTSRSSSRSRSALRQQPMFATSTSTTFPTG